MTFAEFILGALIGSNIVKIIRTTIPKKQAPTLNQLTYFVGKQMIRYETNTIAEYTS